MRAIVDGVERFAVYRGYNGVQCDLCDDFLLTERGEGRRVRQEAYDMGWTCIAGPNGPVDVCPKCQIAQLSAPG